MGYFRGKDDGSAARQAQQQLDANKAAADAQIAALNASASAAADAQRLAGDRSRVEAAASAAASKPLAVADVALDPAVEGSIAATRKRTRAQFGRGASSTGVGI